MRPKNIIRIYSVVIVNMDASTCNNINIGFAKTRQMTVSIKENITPEIIVVLICLSNAL